MARDGSGNYSLPAGNPVVTGTTISSTVQNATMSDIASALTQSVSKDGQTAMTGALNMGNNPITGLTGLSTQSIALSGGVAGPVISVAAPTSGTAMTITAFTGAAALALTTTSSANSLTMSDGTETAYFNTDGSHNWRLGINGAHNLTFFTNNTDRVSINSTGNVTINAPGSGIALTTKGGSSARVAQFDSTAAGSGSFISMSNSGTEYGTLGSALATITSYGGAATDVAINSSTLTGLATGNVFRLTANSTGAITINNPSSGSALTVNGAALTPPNSISFSATPTVDASKSNVHEMGVLTGNITSLTISNATAGQTITIRFKQDGTGSRTVATPTGAKITGSVTATASTACLLTLTYCSADARWEGSYLALPT